MFVLSTRTFLENNLVGSIPKSFFNSELILEFNNDLMSSLKFPNLILLKQFLNTKFSCLIIFCKYTILSIQLFQLFASKQNSDELIGRFCFVPGDTLNWSYNSDQSISTDVCDACWMSAPAWSYYDSLLYSDSLLSPGVCDVYDHCHHSASDNILCGVGYLDETDTSFVNIDYKDYVSEDYLITNYPNPFNSSTNILFSTKNDRNVSVVIYDVNGNHITTLINEYKSAGQHTLDWNGKNEKGVSVSGGAYLYSIEF